MCPYVLYPIPSTTATLGRVPRSLWKVKLVANSVRQPWEIQPIPDVILVAVFLSHHLGQGTDGGKPVAAVGVGRK